MNRQKLAEIKYDLQGQLKMKLHKLEVHAKEVGNMKVFLMKTILKYFQMTISPDL